MRGIANMAFGSDGLHLVALTGPGRVWLQSMPLVVLAHALSEYLGTGDDRSQDAGAAGAGVVGGIIGDMFHS